jgi:glycosyltransferase involved in cell wall biosynthesis
MTSGITVILPVKNEEAIIVGLVNEISSQFEKSDELLIIDAGSSDNTLEILRTLALREERMRLIEASAMYPGLARNMGARLAKNENILFLDAGHDIAADFFECLRLSMGEKNDFVFVNRLLIDAAPLWYQANALLFEPIGVQIKEDYYRHPKVSGMLTTKAQFARVGLFLGWRSGEDREFLERIKMGDFAIQMIPACQMYAQPDRTAMYSLRKKMFYSLDKRGRGVQRYQIKSLLFPGFLMPLFLLPLTLLFQLLTLAGVAGIYFFTRVLNRVRQINRIPNNDYDGSPRVVLFATLWLCLSDLAVTCGLALSIIRGIVTRISRKSA